MKSEFHHLVGPGPLRAHSVAQGCHGQPGEHRQVPRRLLPGAHREQGQREHQLLPGLIKTPTTI